jgi:hypothetical protein
MVRLHQNQRCRRTMSKFTRIEEETPPSTPITKSRAVIASAQGFGVLLWYGGTALDTLTEQYGLELYTLDLDGAPDGISIWEGTYSSKCHAETGEYNLTQSGVFRRPTEQEWADIREGQCPLTH